MNINKLKDIAWVDTRATRVLAGTAFLVRSGLFRLAGRRYRSMSDICQVVRITKHGVVHDVAHRLVMRAIHEIKSTGKNFLVDSFVADTASKKIADRYSISGAGTKDLFRDVIVLKGSTPTEKGVVLLKYGQTFEAVCAIFDLKRLMERYQFVLEPCWAGYCDPAILFFLQPGNPVLVQAFTDEDYRFITEVGAPLVPIRLGPADWVNADMLRPDKSMPKKYDVVMVANWAAHKRHRVLFKALSDIHDRKLNVLLIGFPWGGRSAEDIRREARVNNNSNITYEIVESIPQDIVAHYLNQSRVFVFLSKKEGDNKALVEAMFADVPAVVYEHTIGGATSRINPMTGLLTTEQDLSKTITRVLSRELEFSPRAWALEHTGSRVSTERLNNVLKGATLSSGSSWTRDIVEKVNAPNLAYKDLAKRESFSQDLEFIRSCKLQAAYDKSVN